MTSKLLILQNLLCNTKRNKFNASQTPAADGSYRPHKRDSCSHSPTVRGNPAQASLSLITFGHFLRIQIPTDTYINQPNSTSHPPPTIFSLVSPRTRFNFSTHRVSSHDSDVTGSRPSLLGSSPGLLLAMVRALNLRLALQATAIKVSANLVTQLIIHIRTPGVSTFDLQQVFEFAVYGCLGSQIGNIIQFILEDCFPTGHAIRANEILPQVQADPKQVEEKKDDDNPAKPKRWYNVSPDLIWRNVFAKLILDQTIGLAISGSVFLICTNIARVAHPYLVTEVIRNRLWPLIKAGWHIWPLVAVCNFLWVPVRSRVLVAVCVGFGWSIFLSVFAMRKQN